MPMREDTRGVDNEEAVEKEVPIELPSERVHTEWIKKVSVEHASAPAKPYKPPVPYPQRLLKANEKHKYRKFLEMLKKFHINIPFLKAITDMPFHAEFLKDLLSNKEKLLENATVALIEECNAII